LENKVDLSGIHVTTDLDIDAVGTVLRARNAGFVDGGHAYINTPWLREMHSGHTWTIGLEAMLATAAGHGRFDGVYLEAGIMRTPVGSPSLIGGDIS
jgi:hypothetical protein